MVDAIVQLSIPLSVVAVLDVMCLMRVQTRARSGGHCPPKRHCNKFANRFRVLTRFANDLGMVAFLLNRALMSLVVMEEGGQGNCILMCSHYLNFIFRDVDQEVRCEAFHYCLLRSTALVIARKLFVFEEA